MARRAAVQLAEVGELGDLAGHIRSGAAARIAASSRARWINEAVAVGATSDWTGCAAGAGSTAPRRLPRHSHRHSGMAGIGLLDCIHRQRADGIAHIALERSGGNGRCHRRWPPAADADKKGRCYQAGRACRPHPIRRAKPFIRHRFVLRLGPNFRFGPTASNGLPGSLGHFSPARANRRSAACTAQTRRRAPASGSRADGLRCHNRDSGRLGGPARGDEDARLAPDR